MSGEGGWQITCSKLPVYLTWWKHLGCRSLRLILRHVKTTEAMRRRLLPLLLLLILFLFQLLLVFFPSAAPAVAWLLCFQPIDILLGSLFTDQQRQFGK